MSLIHNILSFSGRPRAVQASGQPYVHFIYDHVGNNTNVRSSLPNDWERNYTYDPVGNVTQVTSSCPWLQNQNFSETFTYDASDQLISASETNSGSYQLTVSYGNWGKITCYSLAQADLQNNTTQSEIQSYTYPAANSLQNSQTLFAPEQRTITDANNNVATETLTFGINGSLRRRDVQAQNSFTEYYLFNSAANLKAYSNNGLDFAYYGYNASNTRTYKISMLNANTWVNGQPEPLSLQLQQAMFYPNAYLNFNHNGEYTKHYYNGSERFASRLGDAQPESFVISSNDRLAFRTMQADQQARADLLEVVEAGDVPIETPSVDVTTLQVSGNPDDIFYYHTNHLGSTAFITDNNTNIHQGFLYAPFGEITTEYDINFGYNVLPKYSFNAKELDEETGMYYYEARYYKPPVFTSRDPMFEKYFWMSPYAYCANNPVKYVDPDGERVFAYDKISRKYMKSYIKDQFGTDKMFRFNRDGELKINKKRYNKALVSANPYQKKLLEGMKSAIDKKEIVKVKVNETSTFFDFVDLIFTGRYDENGFPINKKNRNPFNYDGEGFTMQDSKISYYMIGINNKLAEEATMTTDVLRKIGKDDEVSTCTGNSASSVFFHELLDEFLNYYIEKNVGPDSPQIDKVSYQNAALQNKGKAPRNGQDHD